MSARYWVAQHIADLFRNEPRNIGILVEAAGGTAARFFGELDSGEIDGRRLRPFPYPSVYKQWVAFWRKEMRKTNLSEVAQKSGSHYRVVPGGEVDDVGEGTIHEVVDYLYALVVSEGGFPQAIGVADDAEQSVAALIDDVAASLEDRGLLATNEILVPHPIRRNIFIRGTAALQHRPAFVQQNGHLVVMETVDFTITQKRRARDHAGWAAYMFADIANAQQGTESVAIVRLTEQDRQNEEVANGLALLNNESMIVNWLLPDDRTAFLEQRSRLAF